MKFCMLLIANLYMIVRFIRGKNSLSHFSYLNIDNKSASEQATMSSLQNEDPGCFPDKHSFDRILISNNHVCQKLLKYKCDYSNKHSITFCMYTK